MGAEKPAGNGKISRFEGERKVRNWESSRENLDKKGQQTVRKMGMEVGKCSEEGKNVCMSQCGEYLLTIRK